MPLPGRTELRALYVACATLILIPLTACTLPGTHVFASVSVGQVVGRVERSAPGVSVVQLESVESGVRSAAHDLSSVLVISHGRQQPQIAMVRPNRPVHVENRDAIYHELFSTSQTNLFTTQLAGGAKSNSIVLRKPGLVRVFCKLHPEETFAILVTSAEHIVYLEKQSVFQIPAVPAGEYRIIATGLDGISESTRLRVRAGQTVDLTLRLDPVGDS